MHNRVLDQDLELEIEKLVYGGDGLARLDGRVVMLPYVLPGERVRAREARTGSGFLRAELLEIDTPSPLREDAACPYFRRCGGCHYQHMSYAEELKQKAVILREVLRRIGKIDFSEEIAVVSGEPWHYRNRIQLHIADGKVGYFRPESHELCAVESCPIASPALNTALARLNKALPHLGRFSATVELFTNETDMQVHVADKVPRAARDFFDTLGLTSPIEYDGLRVARLSFFQVNRFLVRPLIDAAVGDSQGDSALDLYAGVGLFARALAKRFRVVEAVESGNSSLRDLNKNAEHSDPAWKAIGSTVEQYLPSVETTPDLILADPPRAGLGPSVIRELLRLRAPLLTLVSCDPPTLARDLAKLAPAYRIGAITLVDLFPRTAHMEAVARLELA